MRITIVLRASDPPEGDVAAEGEKPVTFEGWMGLLSALSDRVSPGSVASPGEHPHELQT